MVNKIKRLYCRWFAGHIRPVDRVEGEYRCTRCRCWIGNPLNAEMILEWKKPFKVNPLNRFKDQLGWYLPFLEKETHEL